MARQLRCSDVGDPKCNFTAEGANDDEVMKKAAEHGRTAHGMTSLPPEVMQKAKQAIRDSGTQPGRGNQPQP